MLVNYVDLKFDDIWSDEYCRKKKWELKEQNFYFRAVKQGSVLVYLTFHVFTILVVLLMAVLRQSILAFGYVFILLPRMRDGAEVLQQSTVNQGKQGASLESRIEALEAEVDAILDAKQGGRGSGPARFDEEEFKHMQANLLKMKFQLKNKKKANSQKTFEEKRDEKAAKAQENWVMISVFEKQLMIFACLDFLLQIVAQLPVFTQTALMTNIGFRKVWQEPQSSPFTYSSYVDTGNHGDSVGLKLSSLNFCLQLLNCVMIGAISLQTEIFYSAGYIKYVTQSDGSMDLLVKLAHLKA
jgi:hypothetical protein